MLHLLFSYSAHLVVQNATEVAKNPRSVPMSNMILFVLLLQPMTSTCRFGLHLWAEVRLLTGQWWRRFGQNGSCKGILGSERKREGNLLQRLPYIGCIRSYLAQISRLAIHQVSRFVSTVHIWIFIFLREEDIWEVGVWFSGEGLKPWKADIIVSFSICVI